MNEFDQLIKNSIMCHYLRDFLIELFRAGVTLRSDNSGFYIIAANGKEYKMVDLELTMDRFADILAYLRN